MQITVRIIFGIAALLLATCASTPAINYRESLSIESDDIRLSISMEIASPIVLGNQWLAEFEIRNNGAAEVSLLPWGTPWEGFLTQDIFRIERGGRLLEYIGPVVKRRAPTSADYIQIGPGSSRVVELDIRSGYDIDRRGDYTLTFLPGSLALRSQGQERIVSAPEMAAMLIQQIED